MIKNNPLKKLTKSSPVPGDLKKCTKKKGKKKKPKEQNKTK